MILRWQQEMQSTVMEQQGEKNPEKKSSREKMNDMLENRRIKTLTKKLLEQKRNEHNDEEATFRKSILTRMEEQVMNKLKTCSKT